LGGAAHGRPTAARRSGPLGGSGGDAVAKGDTNKFNAAIPADFFTSIERAQP
jgi:hypothetical protein